VLLQADSEQTMPFDSVGRNKKGGYRASTYELGACKKDVFSTQEGGDGAIPAATDTYRRQMRLDLAGAALG
jgi:hypothetical protein